MRRAYMIKIISSCFMVLVLLGCFIFPLNTDIVYAQPAEVWVDANNGDDSSDGSQSNPFKTIQKGIDSVAAGGTVHVADGIYKECLIVNKSLVLEGASRNNVVIAPPAEDTGNGWDKTNGSPQNAIKIQASSVTIKELTIDGDANNIENGGTLPNHHNFRHGILIADGADYNNIAIENVNVYNILRRGIFLFPTTGYTGPYSVDGCTVQHVEYQHGISIGSVNAIITNNTVSDVNNGIALHPNSSNPDPNVVATISNNILTDIGHVRDPNTYPPYGIYYRNPSDDRKVIVENNHVTAANNVSSVVGFYIYNANNQSIISNNVVDLSTQTNIDPYVPETSWAWICPLGMYIGGCAGAVIQNNIISLYGTGSGIYLGRGSGGIPVPNIVEGNNIYTTNASANEIDESYGIASSDDKNFDIIGEDQFNTDNIISGNLIKGFIKGILLYDNTEVTYTVSATITNNVIVGNSTGINNTGNTIINAENNWWGANNGPGGQGTGSGDAVSANVDFDPWLVLGVNANPTSIVTGGASTSVITADMTYNSDGQDTSSNGHIPDGTEIIFTTNKGTIGSTTVTKTTVSGKATATLTSSSSVETATVCAEAPHGAAVPEAQYKVCTGVNFVQGASQNVASATGSGTVTVASNIGTVNNLQAIDVLDLPGADRPTIDFPYGLFSFKVKDITPGSCVTVTLTLPSNMPTFTQYWKCQNGHWIDCTSLLGDNDGDNVLTLRLCDGGLGDADGVANGIIDDPGGPAIVVNTKREISPISPRDDSVSPSMPELHMVAPANVTVKYLTVQPQQVYVGQPVNIKFNVANQGDVSTAYEAVLKINGEMVDKHTGSISPHAAHPLSFTVIRDKPGVYTVDINGEKATFTVLDKGGKLSSGVIAGIILGALVIAVIVLGYLVLSRRNAGYN